MKKIVFSFLLFFIGSHLSFAQSQTAYSSSEIYKKIQKLNFLGSVLYVGAHPDDENTALISYLSNVKNARVAYLAMTRGDGGQNLIGPEMRELLGVIRTEELLAARKIDGGQQFFTRANDFGYSKNPDETFRIWDKEKVLSDVVWIFRKFRPDVIINRFDHQTAGETHGHHTASARLSIKAFDLSGRRDVFTDQLKYYPVWQPKRLFFNQSRWFYGSEEKFKKADKSELVKIGLGAYLPVRGISNTEIAALSRSQHKSQGFGSMGSRGTDEDYLEPIKGDFPNNIDSIFAGINTTWSRIKGGRTIGEILYRVQDHFNFKNPAASIPNLLKAYQLINKLDNDHWRRIKTKEIKKIIAACAGLYLQVSSSKEFSTPGEKLDVHIGAINRSDANIMLKNVSISSSGGAVYTFNQKLENNRDFQKTVPFKININAIYTSPYWLRLPFSYAMYRVKKQILIGLPETPPQFVATFHTTVNNVPINFKRALIYKTVTPDKGEVEEPFDIVPEVSVVIPNKTLIFANNTPKQVTVNIKAYKDHISGNIALKHPNNWKVSPASIHININQKGKEKTVIFTVTPPNIKAKGYIEPAFTNGKKTFTKQVHIIDYPHIRTQTVLLPEKTKIIRLDIETRGKNIAYIEGSGDGVPQSLRAIGYQVTLISAKDMTISRLKKYDAVVIGIRAYNTNQSLALNQNVLFDYIKQGGTVITQYNKSFNLKINRIAPYELHLSHNRVTNENSEIDFLAPDNPVLSTPNKITKKDFEGWVQERGLYFPDKWSSEFTAILGMHDRGESQMQGSLLVAKYGKGYFVYTGLSFFRELPAGVAGAYRLFANLLALGN